MYMVAQWAGNGEDLIEMYASNEGISETRLILYTSTFYTKFLFLKIRGSQLVTRFITVKFRNDVRSILSSL